jgi:hypothetical protein
MKRIYVLLLIALATGISSCELESNASYTGNYYSYNNRSNVQNSSRYTNGTAHPEYSKLEYDARQELAASSRCMYKDGGYAGGAVYHPGNVACGTCSH